MKNKGEYTREKQCYKWECNVNDGPERVAEFTLTEKDWSNCLADCQDVEKYLPSIHLPPLADDWGQDK